MRARLHVHDAGLASTFQDTGRPGLAHLGISPAGAVDPAAAAAVNRAVGNPPDTPVVETAGGFSVVAEGRVTVACSRSVAPTVVPDGARYAVAPGGERQWHYLAVRGGPEVDRVLGSSSTDSLSGLGPPPITSGDVIEVRAASAAPVADLHLPSGPVERVRVTPGPRADWFDDEAWSALLATAWTVTAASRVGIRLGGPALRRRVRDELASEGLVRGAIQVPPDGAPVVMSADHPTTGGYPVIAVLDAAGSVAVARVPVGGTIRLSG